MAGVKARRRRSAVARTAFSATLAVRTASVRQGRTALVRHLGCAHCLSPPPWLRALPQSATLAARSASGRHLGCALCLRPPPWLCALPQAASLAARAPRSQQRAGAAYTPRCGQSLRPRVARGHRAGGARAEGAARGGRGRAEPRAGTPNRAAAAQAGGCARHPTRAGKPRRRRHRPTYDGSQRSSAHVACAVRGGTRARARRRRAAPRRRRAARVRAGRHGLRMVISMAAAADG